MRSRLKQWQLGGCGEARALAGVARKVRGGNVPLDVRAAQCQRDEVVEGKVAPSDALAAQVTFHASAFGDGPVINGRSCGRPSLLRPSLAVGAIHRLPKLRVLCIGAAAHLAILLGVCPESLAGEDRVSRPTLRRPLIQLAHLVRVFGSPLLGIFAHFPTVSGGPFGGGGLHSLTVALEIRSVRGSAASLARGAECVWPISPWMKSVQRFFDAAPSASSRHVRNIPVSEVCCP